ncbi:TonB-dependent receptor [Shewanella zhangzhouensis]|uniref:TonB-dependent receptor n=1 Tax=Shewanella zhangzhouensis TaxID=2864213 RepID=UPI001C6609C4|nr:TonB-dependent receptor [Shewanella zhangzhouensis]QYK04687.1 TonB-dependent receptor [Shewanella zhangzhouensis]
MSRTNFRRSLLAASITTLLTINNPVFADNTTGSVYGTAKAGSTVTLVNPKTGIKREVVVGSDGKYSISNIQPGTYTAASDGESHVVIVTIGTGSSVYFGGGSTEVISVIGNRISSIDTSSVESTSVFLADQIELLPVGRDLTSVALLAPGTVQGDSGFGNLASFGGSSVAENAYFLNGFDVTNTRTLLDFADLPYDAVAQQQVKTGGYGAEYGRSLGGVVAVVTKRGTNDWQFGGTVYYTPDSLRASGKDALLNSPTTTPYLAYRSQNQNDKFSYVVHGSGPLIEDKLFFYAMFEGKHNTTDTFSTSGETSSSTENNSPKMLLKLDWNITDDQTFELTALRNKEEIDFVGYEYDEVTHTGQHGTVDPDSIRTFHTGGDILIGKYTAALTDNFTVSALIGSMKNEIYTDPDALPGYECPRVWDSRGPNPNALVYLGCWNRNQATIRDQEFGPDTDERLSYRLSLDWVLGDHNIRAGADIEQWESGAAGITYTGVGFDNKYFRYFTSRGRVNGVDVPAGTEYVRTWDGGSVSANYEVENTAFFIEDTWQVTDELLVYAGLRSESFVNRNADGVAFVEADNSIAPRLGFSYDVAGDSTQKLFGTWGRYYIPVAANTNIRAAGIEWRDIQYFYFEGIDPTTGAPVTIGDEIGQGAFDNRNAANPATIAVTDLDPMHQDELILGYQLALNEDWTTSIKFVHREVKDGMDDYCSHQPFIDWAEDNGYDNFDEDTMAGCLIMNPGKDFNLAMDLNNDGNLTNVTVPNSYIGLQSYDRTYKAIELNLAKASSDDWYMDASYTWSKSEGNIEGYVNSTLEQDDAGLTQDFDHPLFQENAYGYLPNDRRHQFKIFGAYYLTDELSVSANFNLSSGRPVNCNGYVPLTDDLGVDQGGLQGYSASSFFCVDENGEHQPTYRGQYGRTPWTHKLDLGLTYVPHWADNKLTLQMQVYNVLNQDRVTEYVETGDINRAEPQQNPEFLNARNFQSPRYVSFTARYNF